jgi:hypothetical protein
MLGKKKYKTYEEVRDCYENFRSRCKLPIKQKAYKKNHDNHKK